MDWSELIATALKVKKTKVFGTARDLNSRVYPNTFVANSLWMTELWM
jgi:hypothetical protein